MFSADQKTRNYINLNTLEMKKEDSKLPQDKALNIGVVICCCPACKSENITDNSQRKSNGVCGQGFSSWKVTDTRVCNECGIIFKPIKGNCI